MTEDVIVKQEDIDAAAQEVANNTEKIKQEIEAKIKKEMAEEKAKQEKEDSLKKLQEQNAAMQQMLKEKEEQSQKQIEELKAQIGTSKQINVPNSLNVQQPQKLPSDNATLSEVEEASKQAFMEYAKKK